MRSRGIGVVVALSFLIGACSMKHTELARVAAPDGAVVAILDWGVASGAAGPSVVELYLVDAKDQSNLGKPTLSATNCGDLSVSWIDSRTLQVHYSVTCRISGFTNKWFSGAIVHRGADGPTIELILARAGISPGDPVNN